MCGYLVVEAEPDLEAEATSVEVFNDFYDNQRQQMITSYNLKNTITRSVLSEYNITSEDEKYPWDHAFLLPSNYVEGAYFKLIDTDTRFEIMPNMIYNNVEYIDEVYNARSGRFKYERRENLILVNTSPIELHHTYDAPVERFSAVAVDMLALKIAHAACETLGGSVTAKTALFQSIGLKERDIFYHTIASNPVQAVSNRIGRRRTYIAEGDYYI